jgi:hypothetical protein
MAALFQIVYASTAAQAFDHSALMDMLKHSVQRNNRAGVTGLLLFKGGCFMQALEGEEETVKALYAKISRDPRHHNVISLLSEPVEKRYFPDSAMAFRDLNTLELQSLPGYSEFLNTPLNGDLLAKDISKCQRLLLYFKKNIR